MFSRYANGVRAINGSPAFAPTPMALGLNVKRLTHGRVRYDQNFEYPWHASTPGTSKKCRALSFRRLARAATGRSVRVSPTLRLTSLFRMR